jgi:citrate lyase subunit beta/citryl-CoA lyase
MNRKDKMAETTNGRRSWMIVPAHEAGDATRYAALDPDVIVLDLEYSVPPKSKALARDNLKALAKSLADGQAELFVRIERETRWADAAAAVQRGVEGIVFPGPEEASEVSELAALVGEKERESGVEAGHTEIVLVLESAKGFWNAAALAQASPRVTAMGLGRIDLTMRLGPVPQGEFRLQRFLMTRLVVAATMLAKQPLGAFWRPGSRGGVAGNDVTLKAAREGRLMGFTGSFCATPEQVAPVNKGFS